jgi:predicted cupin superfamily sugar epimerase
MRPQLLIPGGTFHAGRLAPGGTAALLGSTSWPGVADGEFEWGDVGALQRRHPDVADLIAAYAGAADAPERALPH